MTSSTCSSFRDVDSDIPRVDKSMEPSFTLGPGGFVDKMVVSVALVEVPFTVISLSMVAVLNVEDSGDTEALVVEGDSVFCSVVDVDSTLLLVPPGCVNISVGQPSSLFVL